MENKRGQVGLDTAKAVMLTLMFVGLLGFLMVLVFQNLSDSSVADGTSGVAYITNETLTSVTETGENFAVFSKPDVSCTIGLVVNSTDGAVITSVNYTQSNCNLAVPTGIGAGGTFNNTDWKVHYSYEYNAYYGIHTNISSGTTDFFSNTGTWFALLAVVVIILIIAIVIFAVNRFGGRQGGL